MTVTLPVRVPVLMYHEIADTAQTSSRLAVSPAAFASQLGYLRAAGFTALTAGAVASILADGSGTLPERPVVLTFDDGYEDFYSAAMPLLHEYGFTATLFMTSGFVRDGQVRRDGTQPMLSWKELAEAAAAGIEIAAHTAMHPQLDQLPADRLHEELHASKDKLQDELGFEVPGLAYPFGYSNAEVRRTARDIGYAYAYAVDNAMTTDGSDAFALPRLTVARGTTIESFGKMVHGQDTVALKRNRALTQGYSVVRRTRAALRTPR